MRKLDLKNYTYLVKDQQGVDRIHLYNFKDVLLNILTHPTLGLNGPELLEMKPFINNIEKANLEIVLTEDEYDKIVDTCKRFRGFSKNDILFLERIYNCTEIPDDGKKVVELSKFRGK